METMKIDEKRSARPTRLNNLEIALAVLSTVSDSGRMVNSHEVEQAAKTASAGHPEVRLPARSEPPERPKATLGVVSFQSTRRAIVRSG
jgi:hypothetical protein